MAIDSIPAEILNNAVYTAKKAKNDLIPLVPVIKALAKPILYLTGGTVCIGLAFIFAAKSFAAFTSVPLIGPAGVLIGLFDMAMAGLLIVAATAQMRKFMDLTSP